MIAWSVCCLWSGVGRSKGGSDPKKKIIFFFRFLYPIWWDKKRSKTWQQIWQWQKTKPWQKIPTQQTPEQNQETDQTRPATAWYGRNRTSLWRLDVHFVPLKEVIAVRKQWFDDVKFFGRYRSHIVYNLILSRIQIQFSYNFIPRFTSFRTKKDCNLLILYKKEA